MIHEADAPLLRSRRAHVDQYVEVRQQYLNNPNAVEEQTKAADHVISGEMEPTMLVTGGETLSLGGDVTVSVHHIPGHTAGSVAYVVDGQKSVFVGDAVQIHGAANGFPGYEDPVAYRSSLQYLRDEVRPQHLYLGHPYRSADGVPYGVELDASAARTALQGSLDLEARIDDAAAPLSARRPAGDGLPVLPVRAGRRGARLHGRPHAGALAVLHHAARLPPAGRLTPSRETISSTTAARTQGMRAAFFACRISRRPSRYPRWQPPPGFRPGPSVPPTLLPVERT